MIRMLLALALLLGSWALPGPGGAVAGAPEIRLVQADVEPLGSVLQTIARRFPGRALDAQLSRSDGDAVYRIKWLGDDGRVRDITVDARTGRILRVR